MIEQLIFDTDCISAFLWVGRENLLLKLYAGRIVLPKQFSRNFHTQVYLI